MARDASGDSRSSLSGPPCFAPALGVYDWFLGIATSFTSTARSSLLCAAGWWSIGSLLEAPRRLVERRCGCLCDKLRQCHPLRAHFRLSWPVVSRLPAAWACLVRLVAWQLDSFDFSASLLHGLRQEVLCLHSWLVINWLASRAPCRLVLAGAAATVTDSGRVILSDELIYPVVGLQPEVPCRLGSPEAACHIAAHHSLCSSVCFTFIC